jgi:hypothetical protein
MNKISAVARQTVQLLLCGGKGPDAVALNKAHIEVLLCCWSSLNKAHIKILLC